MTKYNNKKVVLNGITFDSQKEARRYRDLSLLERAGEIKNLELQKAFILAESVKFENEPRRKPAIKYVADFVYQEKGRVQEMWVKPQVKQLTHDCAPRKGVPCPPELAAKVKGAFKRGVA